MNNEYYVKEGKCYFSFKYSPNIIEDIKCLEGRWYHPESKEWSVPITLLSKSDLLTLIKKHRFEQIEPKTDINPNLVKENALQALKSYKNDIISLGLKFTLRDYQYQGVDLMNHFGNCINGDDMGLGKTLQTIYAVETMNNFPCLVICPSSVKYHWGEYWSASNSNRSVSVIDSKHKIKNFDADVVIVNYDMISKTEKYEKDGEEKKRAIMKIEELNKEWECIVLDECFPAGTKINTPFGFKNIELIKEGDIIFNAIGCGVVKKTNNQFSELLVRLHLNNGESIDVTPNHPFFTTIGWVKAIDLKNKIILSKSDILNIFAHNIILKFYGKKGKFMRMVWKIFTGNILRKTFLQQILLSEMEEYSPGNKKGIKIKGEIRKDKCCFKKSTPKKSSMGIKSIKINENKQPCIKSRNSGKNKSHMEDSGASINPSTVKRWKWKTFTESTKNIMGSIRARMESRTSYSYKTENGLSNKLQNGYSVSKIQDMDRSGWLESHIRRWKIKRQEKRRSFGFVRVERVEILKQRGGKQFTGCVVYNLQVSGHPSYYTEGFLVHNCHYIKNGKANRTKIVQKLRKKAKRKIGLTGTIVQNKPIEVYQPLMFIEKFIPNFRNWKFFTERYCDAQLTRFGMDTSGASNVLELNKILKNTCYIRREKADVWDELPIRQDTIENIELTNIKQYLKAEDNFLDFVNETFSEEKAEKAFMAEFLVQRSVLRQLSVKEKLKGIIEWLENYQESTSEKLLVFGIHTEPLTKLAVHFDGDIIDGSIDAQSKYRLIQDFKTNKKQMIFGNIKAMGTGTDGLQHAASNIVFTELPDNPAQLDQAISRVERIGVKNAINVWFLLSDQTIDIGLWEVIQYKRVITEAINKGQDVKPISFNEVMVKKMLEKRRLI